VTESLPPDLTGNDFDAALLADNTAVFHTLVFTAIALVILGWTENLGAEQAFTLRLKSPVVYGFRLFYFTEGTFPNLFGRNQRQPNSIEAERIFRPFEKAEYIFQISPSL
jgi:hypothetical protein